VLYYALGDAALTPLEESLDDNAEWGVVEGPFIQVWAVNGSRSDRSACIWPGEDNLSDGLWHIMLIRGLLTARSIRRIFKRLRKGRHTLLPGVEFVHTSAFRLMGVDSAIRVDGQRVSFSLWVLTLLRQ